MITLQNIGFILIIIFHTINCDSVVAQNKYTYIADFNESFENNPQLGYLEKEFDLLKILLLDSTKQELIFEHDPGLETSYKEYSKSLALSKNTVGFITDYNKIELVVNSQERIFDCVFTEKEMLGINCSIKEPIYIYENKAIIEIQSRMTSDLYYIRLHDGVVQINWVGGVIE